MFCVPNSIRGLADTLDHKFNHFEFMPCEISCNNICSKAYPFNFIDSTIYHLHLLLENEQKTCLSVLKTA